MLSHAELRALMLPWTGVLRDYVDLGKWTATWNANRERVVWVEMVNDSARGIELRAFDAMELLTLLGQIDFAAWRAALAACWPRHASAWIEAANGKPLRFGWKVHFHAANDGLVDIAKWCDRVVVDGIECTRSREYLRARTVLEDLYDSTEVADNKLPRPVARERLEIPVHLIMHSGPMEQRLLRLLEVVSLQHARETSSVSLFRGRRWKPLMRVTDISTGEVADCLSRSAFLNSAQIAAYGVQLSKLPLHQVDVTVDTALLYTAGLQCLLGAANVVGQSVPGHTMAVKTVAIPAAMTRPTVSAIYSALMTSQSVTSVSINATPVRYEPHIAVEVKMSADDFDNLWRWIAVALFSYQATNRIDTAEIDVADLTAMSVAVMDVLLRGQDLLAFLSPGANAKPTISPDATGYVNASKFRVFSPDSEAPVGVNPVVDLAYQTVRVIEKISHESIAVLLPGWGKAWVRETDCEVADIATARVNRRQIRSISRLTLTNITVHSMAAVLSLLWLVGENVNTLELTAIKVGDPLDDWLREIFRACPHLEELRLSDGGKFGLNNVIARSYEEGICRLRSLAMHGVGVTDAASVSNFFLKLTDTHHLMTQHLRELDITLVRMDEPLPQVATALHMVFMENSSLESLHLVVSFRAHRPQDQLIPIKTFSQYETPIAVRMLPLSLSKKVAFLSVTSPRGREDQAKDPLARVLHQLDSQIISRIFQFAAQCRTRSVSVLFVNQGPHP